MSEPATKPRILIADDDPDVRATLTEILEMHGAEVTAVPDGLAAVNTAACEPFDLCILDIEMPKMSGLEACPRVCRTACTKNLPILFLTGCADADSIKKAFDAGAWDFLAKPVHPILLWRRVSNLLLLARLKHERDNLNDVMRIENMPPLSANVPEPQA